MTPEEARTLVELLRRYAELPADQRERFRELLYQRLKESRERRTLH